MKRVFAFAICLLILPSLALSERPDSCKRFADTLRLRKICEPLYARADALDCSDIRIAAKKMGEIRKECDALSAPLRAQNEAKAAAISEKLEKMKNASPEEKAAMRDKFIAAREARRKAEGE